MTGVRIHRCALAAVKNAVVNHCDLAGIIGRRDAAPVNVQLYV
jgi:hypothetical protein